MQSDRLNPSNRRVRTRMHGGVGGAGPRGSPLSRLCAEHDREAYFDTCAPQMYDDVIAPVINPPIDIRISLPVHSALTMTTPYGKNAVKWGLWGNTFPRGYPPCRQTPVVADV